LEKTSSVATQWSNIFLKGVPALATGSTSAKKLITVKAIKKKDIWINITAILPDIFFQ
jgi:hypothetical protein